MGGASPGADMRGPQQAKTCQVLHGVADRGRRQLHSTLGQGPGTHRLTGFDVTLDHTPEYLSGPAVQLHQGWARAQQGMGQVVGSHGNMDEASLI